MSDIRLFQTTDPTGVKELSGTALALEKSLQTLIERNMETFLGVRFLATEFQTTHHGRMDSLGLDENASPVIVEYKRASNENVINQGLFYLDWLMDHRRDFEWLVLEKYGRETAKTIDWSSPRLICIAGDFTKFDLHAVNQINRTVDLLRYRRFGEELLLLESLTRTEGRPGSEAVPPAPATSPKQRQKSFTDNLAGADEKLRDLYESVSAFMLALGDDVQSKTLAYYIAFRRLKNFACVEVKPVLGQLKIYLKVAPETIRLEEGFTRDVRHIGHYGTGDLEVVVSDRESFRRAQPLIESSYDAS